MAGWLLENGIVTAVLAAVVWGVCRWRRVGPVWRHALWMVVLLKLLMPTVGAWPWAVRDPLGSVPVAGETRDRGTMELLASLLKADDGPARGNAASTGSKSDSASVQPAQGKTQAAAASPASAQDVAVAAGASELPARTTWRWSGGHLLAAVVAAWLAGTLGFVTLQCVRIARMVRRVRGATRCAGGALEREVGELAGRMRMRPIRACPVAGLESPYVWSLFRPVLLWPAGWAWESEAARGMIVHELAHVKRRDHWVGWMMLVAGCVWWWNPVYWVVCRGIRENAEFACDAWAVRTLPGMRRRYAEGLLEIVEGGFRPRLPLAVGIRDGGARILKARLVMIMKGDTAVRLPRVGVALLAVVVLVSVPAWAQEGGAAAGRPKFTLSKETTVITGPLNADGTPDYVGAMNAKYSAGVTPENNGFVAWLGIVGTRQEDGTLPMLIRDRVLKMSGAEPTLAGALVWKTYGSYLNNKKLDGEKWQAAYDEMLYARLELWTREQHADCAEYLSANDQWMRKIAEAAKRPKWWVPSVSADFKRSVMMEVLLPSLGMVREAGYEFGARATMRANGGDFEGFLEDVMTAKRLGRQMGSGETVIEGLVGAGINHYADDALGTVVGSGRLTVAQCDAVRRELDGLAPSGDIAEQIGFERWQALDNIFWLFYGDGAGQLSTTLTGNAGDDIADKMQKSLSSIQREEVDLDVILKRTNQVYEGLIAGAKTGTLAEVRKGGAEYEARIKQWTQERNASADLRKAAGETKAAYSERVARAVVSVTASDLNKAVEMGRAEVVRDELADVLLAAARARARTGHWPVTLEELVPAGMREVPEDFFSEGGKKAVKYGVTEGGAWVYSVGMDGVDGGGRSSAAKRSDDIVVGKQE